MPKTLIAAPEPSEPYAALDGDALVIRGLRVTDPDVLAAARRQHASFPDGDLGPWAASLLSLAARSLSLATGSIDDGAVGARLDALAHRVDGSADAAASRVEGAVLAATDPDRGAVATAVSGALGRLSADVRSLVAGEQAPLRLAVDQALDRAVQAALAEIGRNLAAQTAAVRAALSADDPGAAFAVLRREVRSSSEATRAELSRQLVELRGLVEAARAREEMVGRTSSLQGATFEDSVLAAVTEAAAGLGDTVEPTGHQVGLRPGCKVGDLVASVAERTTGGQPVSVVVEAKSSPLSSRRWKAELAEARENRGAHGAVGVVNGVERMPGRSRTVFVLDPATVIVAWSPGDPVDLLAAVYQLTRAAAVAAALEEAGPGALDAAHFSAALAEAYEALAGFDAILRAEAAARRGLDDLRAAARQLRATLEGVLARGLGHEQRRGA